MTIRASATDKRITHHISLTNNAGTTTIGLKLVDPKSIIESPLQQTSLKMSQGDTDYSDFNLPFTPITQKDWKGGRAQLNFEDDKTRYMGTYQIDTSRGDIRLAPKSTLTTGYETIMSNSGTASTVVLDANGSDMWASAIHATATKTYQRLSLSVYNPNAVEIIIQTAIWTNSVGKPGSLVSGSVSSLARVQTNTEAQSIDFFMTGAALTSGTEYWLLIYTIHPVATATPPYYQVTFSTVADASDITIKFGSNWNAVKATSALAYQLGEMPNSQARFFEYKGAIYAVINSSSGGAPRLFMNGFRGVAQATYATSNFVGSWSTGTLTNKIVKVTGGKGYNSFTNWRKIISGSAGTYAVAPYWDFTPDNTTELVVLGCDTWQEIGIGSAPDAHGLTASVTDICVVNGIVYFAQGEAVTMRRMREYNSSGTWTREFADDGTNKSTFIEPITATTGKIQIWKCNNPTDGSAPNVSYSGVKAWGTALDFTTKPTEITGDWPILVGDSTSKITGIAPYGTPTMPWVMKEDSFGAVSNGIWAPVPISEMRSVRSEDNGAAVAQYGVYLYFSLLDGLEKYYDNRLDDIGPNLDEGFVVGRRGRVSKIISYPGRPIILYDAGDTGESCILVQVEGWHEIQRASIGRRIRDGIVQVIPGDTVDRLWYDVSGSIYWIPIAVNPDNTTGYQYESYGYIVSSWFNGGFKEINKFWSALQLFTKNLSASHIYINAAYQTDIDTIFHNTNGPFNVSPMQKGSLEATNTAYGKRWRYRLWLITDNPSVSPIVEAVTVESITRVPMKSTWTLTAYADDAGRDLQGKHETLTAKGLLDQLKTWANSDSTPTPLTMHSNLGMFDSKTVFIENPRIRPVNININGARQTVYVAECSVIGVD